MKSISRTLLVVVFISIGSLAANAQQPQQPASAQKQQAKATPAPGAKAAPAKPAPAKVWTDDDVSSLRSPADDYARQQQAEADAAAAAKQTTAAATTKNTQDQDGTFPVVQVKTAQEADAAIAKKQSYLAGEQDYLQRLRVQLSDSTVTGIEKQRLEWRLKSHTMTTQTLQTQIKKLQDEKDALAKKPQPAPASSSSSSQPQSQ